MTARHYSNFQNSIISFGCVDFYPKTFLTLYSSLENSTTCIAIACTIKLLRHNNINATLSRIWPQFKAAASVPPCIIHIVCKYSDSLCKRENGKSKEGSRKLYLLRTMSRCHSVLELHFVNSKDTTFLVKNGKKFPKLSWKKLNSLFGK